MDNGRGGVSDHKIWSFCYGNCSLIIAKIIKVYSLS